MKRSCVHIIIPFLLFMAANSYCTSAFAQVKIGDNPNLVNPNAILETETTNKGFLMPRVALVACSNPTPLATFVNGMLVFNTAANDSVSVGLYYSEGTKWVKVNVNQSVMDSWKLSGNAGTTAGDFIGTTDMAPVSVKTNNTERLHITENGWVGIGTATPAAALHVKGQLVIDSINGGNIATDSLLVADPANGKVKAVSAAGFVSGASKRLDIVAVTGQTVFTTPVTITDANKVSLYRNGVLISFTVSGIASITAEVPCIAGDEIRIIQLL